MADMPENAEWREVLCWWWGTPYLLVFDPKQVIRTDPLLWPCLGTERDDDDFELLELTKRLAMLKGSKKH